MKKTLALLTVILLAASVVSACGTRGGGAFDTEREITVLSREDGSGTRSAFVELFGVKREDESGKSYDATTPEAIITNNTSVMISTVAQDKYAIGYISLGALGGSVKALAIDGVQPTTANIESGLYPVLRPFNIVTKDVPSAAAQDFIGFILSADGQRVVADTGYISNADAPAYSPGGLSGAITVAGSSSVSPVMEKLKEAYIALNPAVSIEIQQSDSTTGVTNTVEGICDIGMVSRELRDSERAAGIIDTVIARDGLVVIVGNDNPLAELSGETVRAVFSGDIIRWGDVLEQ